MRKSIFLVFFSSICTFESCYNTKAPKSIAAAYLNN